MSHRSFAHIVSELKYKWNWVGNWQKRFCMNQILQEMGSVLEKTSLFPIWYECVGSQSIEERGFNYFCEAEYVNCASLKSINAGFNRINKTWNHYKMGYLRVTVY